MKDCCCFARLISGRIRMTRSSEVSSSSGIELEDIIGNVELIWRGDLTEYRFNFPGRALSLLGYSTHHAMGGSSHDLCIATAWITSPDRLGLDGPSIPPHLLRTKRCSSMERRARHVLVYNLRFFNKMARISSTRRAVRKSPRSLAMGSITTGTATLGSGNPLASSGGFSVHSVR